MHHSDILVRDAGLWVGLILVAGRLQPDHQYVKKMRREEKFKQSSKPYEEGKLVYLSLPAAPLP